MAEKDNTYTSRFGRTIKPSLKARENAATAAAEHKVMKKGSLPEIPPFKPRTRNVTEVQGVSRHSEGGKSRVNYDIAKKRLEIEHKKKLLELEEDELEQSIRDSEKSSVQSRQHKRLSCSKPPTDRSKHFDGLCEDDDNGKFSLNEESIQPEALTKEWIKHHDVFRRNDEHRRDEFRSNAGAKDWIDSIGTVEEQNAIQAKAMRSNSVVPLMLSGLQEFMIDEFSGDPAEWPDWSIDFKNKVHDCIILTTSQKMSILKKSLSEEPKSLVYALLYDACHYKTALSELRRRYGAPDVVAKAQIERIRNLDSLRDTSGIVKFRTEVGRLVHIFQSMNMTADLQGQVLLSELVRKLSQGMKESWGNFVRKRGPGSVLLMYEWLGQKEESLRLGGGMAFGSSNSTKSQKSARRQMNVINESVKPPGPSSSSSSLNRATPKKPVPYQSPSASDTVSKCLYCSKDHWIDECSEFAKKNPENRLEWFKTERLCFKCAKKFHSSRGCYSRIVCKVCKGKHQTILHDAFTRPDTHPLPEKSVSDNHTSTSNPDVYLMVLPVRIYAPSGLSFETNCLVDSGSQACFISQKIASTLELKGPKYNLKLSNVARDLEPMVSQRFQIRVCDPNDSAQSCISINEVWSFRDNFNLPDQTIPRDVNGHPKWGHVSDLNIPDIAGNEIGLLIGANCKEALRELRIRKGPDNLPDAVQLQLGWCIRGAVNTGSITESLSTNTCSLALAIENESTLNKLVESFWSTEGFGCKFQNEVDMSMNDRYAIDLLSKTIRKLSFGQYEVGMLWVPEFESLADNTSQSVAKYHSLRRRLCKNPDMKEKYCAAMNKNIEQGFARKLSKDEAALKTSKTHTISHHGVWNPMKQKMRPVFDAAATFEGTSLNDHLLSGPDLTNNADAVKMRFRMGKIPMSADVENMFCRVRVPTEDTDALRFIWDPELGPNPKTYKMLVHIFGAKSSPTCANFAMRQTAFDHTHDFPMNAINVILQSTYVDDFLFSADSKEEAVQITKDVITILATGGFKLTKWVSPCQAVLDAACSSSEGITSTVNLDLDESPVSRALGQHWEVRRDAFGFKPCILNKPLTKRGLLSEISSVYDPLGFLAPFLIRAKILFQTLWVSKSDWDDVISEEVAKRWREWLEELPDLEALNIPRKYWPADLNATQISLHVFVDASEKAYCCVCHVRVKSDDGDIHVSLILSRTRVAPVSKKRLTIPRLELQAAVLGVRMSDTITRELPYQWDYVKFWTDSVTVIQYLSNDAKRFKTFVSNRVAEIRGSSKPSQWSHVPGHLNPADEGTRGLSASELLSENCRWFRGPPFLWSPEETWPEQPHVLSIPCDDVEVKMTVLATRKYEIVDPLVDCTNFSSLDRLLTVTAWCQRFIHNARKTARMPDDRIFGPLTGADIRAAKLYWITNIQQERYPAEVEALIKTETLLPNDSSLLPLLPLSENGILRVGGRVDRAMIPYDARHQMIIPANHAFTALLILDIHVRLQHAGPGTVMAQSRQMFWIVKCRSQVQKALRQCMVCRNLNVKPTVPRIAPLPAARVIAENPVFHYCGVDYFGPLVIKERRSRVKRWVALFTCLSTRALHLEVVNTLSTDGFIMAYRRFIARRSEPAEIFCDNGSNFRGAEPELRECVKRLNSDEKFHSFMSKREIVFHFNPPRAPHMGGAWERLVRSVKVAMKAVFKDRVVYEDILTTSLAEIENAINSRPLTTVSSDASDPEPLTPRHLLAPSSSFQVTPQDSPMPGDETCRRRWRQAQFIVNQFWRRWKREYLPNLTVAQKWRTENRSLTAGDVVIVVDDSLPRGLWPLGRVLETFAGKDGRVRAVNVKTRNGVFKRPACKLCFLEMS